MPTLAQPQQSFRPLEYWKPPKAVRHIRSKSSQIFAKETAVTSKPVARPTSSVYSNDLELGEDYDPDRKDKSLGTISEMTSRSKNPFQENIAMGGPPPAYKIDADGTLSPRWYDVKAWGKRVWAGVIAGIVIIIIIIVVVAVVVSKKNKYPDYSKLTYSLSETCLSFHVLHQNTQLTNSRLWFDIFRSVRLLYRIRPICRICPLR